MTGGGVLNRFTASTAAPWPEGMAHTQVTVVMPASCERVFDLLHDYDRRLPWDTLLRAARLKGAERADVGVVAVCTARRALGGCAFRTRYVTFRRPDLAAVTLIGTVEPVALAAFRWETRRRLRALAVELGQDRGWPQVSR